MIYFIAKFIADLFGIDTTRAQFYVIGVLLFAVLIIVGLTISQCGAGRENRQREKLNEINAQIGNREAGKAVIEAQKANANNDSQNTSAATNQAKGNLKRAREVNTKNINGRDLDTLANKYQ